MITDSDLSPGERLLHAAAHATASRITMAAPDAAALAEPDRLHRTVVDLVGPGRTVVVAGTLERRLVFVEGEPGWTVADLSGHPHGTRSWPPWALDQVRLASPESWLSDADVSAEGRWRLLRPRLLLASLYHPEHFPLPRFPLAVSDLARAARSTLLGRVELMDMQLGAGLEATPFS